MFPKFYKPNKLFMGGGAGGGPPKTQTSSPKEKPKPHVTYQGHQMTSDTAKAFKDLVKALKENGYDVTVTSTTTGDHTSQAHKDGRAVDFVATKDGKPISNNDSNDVENICNDNGWHTYNEYTHDSKYKTGDHMHVSR